jgi:hypothetical protein
VLHPDQADLTGPGRQRRRDPLVLLAGEPEDGVNAPVGQPVDQQLGRERLHPASLAAHACRNATSLPGCVAMKE